MKGKKLKQRRPPDIRYAPEARRSWEVLLARQDVVHRNIQAVQAVEWIEPRAKPDPDWEPLAFRRLFVESADDVLELAPSELEVVWKHRDRLCGSVQAAAEVNAFLRVQQGLDEFYAGHEAFLGLPEVQQAGALLSDIDNLEDCAPVVVQVPDEPPVINSVSWPHPVLLPREIVEMPAHGGGGSLVSAEAPTPTLEPAAAELILHEDDIEHMSHAALHQAWKMRKVAFADLRAAAAALARLRYENRSDSSLRSLEGYLSHPLIQQLVDDLPERAHEAGKDDDQTAAAQEEVNVDARTYAVRRTAVREGQVGFRQSLINTYGLRCCVTGTEQSEVLQAAHIQPYKGAHTNELANGLLLRGDIHQLFDAHLLSIHPDRLTVEVSGRVVDGYYRSLHGQVVDVGETVSRERLRMHHRMYELKSLNASWRGPPPKMKNPCQADLEQGLRDHG